MKTDALIYIIRKARSLGIDIDTGMLQKLSYLAGHAGADIRYRHILNQYGPYSDGVDYAVKDMIADDIINMDVSRHPYRLYAPKAANIQNEGYPQIDAVLGAFGALTRDALILHTSILYIIKETGHIEDIIPTINKIFSAKYGEHEIKEVTEQLRQFKYFNI